MSEILSRLLSPAGSLFEFGVGLRNRRFDQGLIPVEDCGRPVVSIGNLTTGGTGKTPFTKLLAQTLIAQSKLKVSIVSRGYKGASEKTTAEVRLDDELSVAAAIYGDEPTMLAHLVKGVSVFVGAKKSEVAKLAVKTANPDLILADDAFQHRGLKRSFDIVLLDTTEPWWHFKPLPAGRLREPFTSLKRAQAVVFTKVNLAETGKLARLRDAARAEVDSSDLPIFLELEYRIQNLSKLSDFHEGGGTPITASDLAKEKLFLLSAIGRPQAFQKSVEQATGANVVGSLALPDHSAFTSGSIAQAVAEAKNQGASFLIMTEKDAVKLHPSKFPSDFMPLVTHLDALPQANWTELYERVARLAL